MPNFRILALTAALVGIAALPAAAQTAPTSTPTTEQSQTVLPDTGVKPTPAPVSKPKLHKHVHHHAAKATVEPAAPSAKH